jgi:predicted enzyme related to lactoylglutathione lyase
MQIKRFLSVILVAGIGFAPISSFAKPPQSPAGDLAVGPQYDTTHVYVAPEDFARFVASLTATLGGTTSKQGVFTVTPTPSQTMSQLVLTPVGTLSVFGFKTPIPYPFGAERTGYLVKDLDAAVRLAQAHGADVIVTSFPDPIGRDVVIQWPGGINMQLYWHTTAPSYGALTTVPENRVYVSREKATEFVRRFLEFSHGTVRADVPNAPGVEIGKPEGSYHSLLLESRFGKMNVIATDGHLPWPYGRETTGYEVLDLTATLGKARANGVTVLTQPVVARGRQSVMLQFPGGYIAEIHSATP